MKKLKIKELLKESRWAREVPNVAQITFTALLIVLLVLLLVDYISTASVSSSFNLNYLLIIILVVGIIALFARSRMATDEKEGSATTKGFLIVVCIGVGSALLVWHGVNQIGPLSYVISALSGVLISTLSLLSYGLGIKLPNRRNIDRIRSVVEPSYLQLCLIFAILVLIYMLNPYALRLNYQLFAYVLPLFAIPTLLCLPKVQGWKLAKAPLILISIFVFALLIRIIPYINSDVPLGYDAGIYKYVIDLYSEAMPGMPEDSLAGWIKDVFPQGFPVLTNLLHIGPGFTAIQIIQGFFIFLGAFLVFPVFFVTRNLFGTKVGLIAALLYAVSFTQYSVYTFAYLKNIIGLCLLLYAIYALENKRYILLAIMYAGLGIFHRPEFLLLSLLLIPYFIRTRDKYLLLGVAGAAALIMPFWIPRLDIYFGVISEAVGGTGTFFDLARYQTVALAYLPFVFVGFLYLLTRKKWNSLFFYFTINFVIVIGQILFFRRFIIPLDIIFVILAAVGICVTLLNFKGYAKVVGLAVLVLVVVSSGIITTQEAVETTSLINHEQLSAIEWIADNTEEDAYVVASSYDAPWVLGWSDRKVVAPGLFEWNEHNQEEWSRFFKTKNPDQTKDFLNTYEGPLYIYHSNHPDSQLGLQKFFRQPFKVVYNDVAIVYRYYPAGMP